MRRLSGVLLAILCLALGGSPASAQGAYPNKTIRVLIPYAPGGLTDVVARYYGEYLRKTLGQNVLVENKPGASGIIAIEEMARAKPDGYTIMVGNISTNCLTPVLLAKRMHIDYDRDVQIIARLADTPVFFMATTTNFPPKTFAGVHRLRQGASRRRALRLGRRRRLSARQHRDPGEARRRPRPRPHPVQGRRRRHPQGCRRRRHPCVLVQRQQPGRHDQGRQGAAARGRGGRAAARLAGRADARRTGLQGFHPSQWSAASRRPACRARSSTSCTTHLPKRPRRRSCRRSSRRAA